jgi:hypothetical protein
MGVVRPYGADLIFESLEELDVDVGHELEELRVLRREVLLGRLPIGVQLLELLGNGGVAGGVLLLGLSLLRGELALLLLVVHEQRVSVVDLPLHNWIAAYECRVSCVVCVSCVV